MASPTGTLAMEIMERIRRDIDKSFFFDAFTTTAAAPSKPLTQDAIRGWIKEAGRLLADYVKPVEFIIKDAQQQRRTPVIGRCFVRPEKLRTKTRKQGRKCSRRKWKSMNRRQWLAVPIYAEPEDVLVFSGKSLVTPRQYQAIKDATIKQNSTS